MEGITCPELLEHSLKLLDTTLDGGLIEKISDWEPVASPVPDTTLDGRPMEGTTKLEHSALVGSLDSGLMAGMSCQEPWKQSVLNTLLVARPVEVITESDMLERSALVSQGDCGQLESESRSRPMVNVALDWRPMEEISAPLPVELLGLALAPDGRHVEHLPSSRPLEHSVLEAKRGNDNLNSSNEPQFGSDLKQSSLKLEDAIRREVLESRLMGRVSARDVNGLLCCCHRRMLVWVIRKCLWMRSVRRAYGSGIWTWMWNINMRHLTVCRCITVGICMIWRTRRSTILSKWCAQRMWRTIILMFRREWN